MYLEVFQKQKIPIFFIATGLILIGIALVILLAGHKGLASSGVEVLREPGMKLSKIVVEVSGEVSKPGVYEFEQGQRVQDALSSAGGLNGFEDKDWIARSLNKAAMLSDGQKIYIPKQSQGTSANKNDLYQTASQTIGQVLSNTIDINKASSKELESLPGIGPSYAQKIVEQRPYSNSHELIEKGILNQNLFNKISALISVY